jgi:hypothetical protein
MSGQISIKVYEDPPSVTFAARSKMPTAGLVNALQSYLVVILLTHTNKSYPTTPLPTPLKKPAAPPDSAPSMGFIYIMK